MTHLLTTFIFALLPGILMAQAAPVDVVQRQLEAYNERDIEAFIETFHDTAIFVDFKTGEIRMKGKMDIKEKFDSYFKESPELHSDVIKRMEIGNSVIDHEHIVGSRGSAEMREIIMIYEVNEGSDHESHSYLQGVAINVNITMFSVRGLDEKKLISHRKSSVAHQSLNFGISSPE